MGGRRYHALLGLGFVLAAHCMVAHMALSVTSSFVAGHSITVFALFIGLYLAAMGGGVLVVERFTASGSEWTRRLLLLSTAAALAANPGVPGLMLAHEAFGRGPAGAILVWALAIALALLLGAIAGAFLPIVSKVAEAEGWPPARPLIGVLTSDYAGAALGATAFALILYPRVGLVHAVVLSQAVIIFAINLTAVALGLARTSPTRTLGLLLLLDLWLVASLSLQDRFVVLLDGVPV